MYLHAFPYICNFIRKQRKGRGLSLLLSLNALYKCSRKRKYKRKRTASLCLSLCVYLSLPMPRLAHVYVLSDDMEYKREKSRRTVSFSLFFWLSVCLSVSLFRLIHMYMLVRLYGFTIQNHVHVFFHYTKHVLYACMHIRGMFKTNVNFHCSVNMFWYITVNFIWQQFAVFRLFTEKISCI